MLEVGKYVVSSTFSIGGVVVVSGSGVVVVADLFSPRS